MVSLTPKSKSDEVTGAAMREGYVNGAMVFIPALGALYAGLQNPKFRRITNWQSRTAMVLMPTLFAFGFTSESRLTERMHQLADETEHAVRAVEWAERHQNSSKEDYFKAQKLSEEERGNLMTLYRQSVLESGPRVRLVESDSLAFYQKAANYVQSDPIKVLAGVGIPAVALIFAGQNEGMQMRILHTRVYGQFTIICTMLSIMGMKEYMDRHGTFITESDVEDRVQELADTRQSMMERFEREAAQYEKMLHGSH